MVLISIHPFALRKIFLVIVAFLCFSALCSADPVLMVHRYAAPPEHRAGANVAGPALREPLGAQDAAGDESGFGPLGSIDSPGNQTELRFTEPGKIGLPATLPSSVFRKAMCELRSTDFQAATIAKPNLPLPGEN
jgi:hypothetical protein